jgi:hypothetical protein
MTKTFGVAAALLLCVILSSPQDQPTRPTHPAHASTETTASPAEDSATREELQKMKALVRQMQTNLAFVTSTQGPLKHQFELEIEMWQLEIARLERRLGPEPKRE